MRAADRFNEAVVATAGKHRALRAQPIGDELERRVAVVIEPANETRRALPGDAGGIEPGGDLAEEIGRFAGQKFVDSRRAVDDRPIGMRLAVEDTQRISLEPGLAVLAQRRRMAAEMLVERIAPAFARFRVAERVELENRSLDPELLQQLVGKSEQLD